ncbi:hypothetical protein DFJ74DRAFT_687716 [Hyaloraphidium curvatum]|nr:hypothetical protein DFJ74DRAFT_687716 [Hyaloraphidium curvatum]
MRERAFLMRLFAAALALVLFAAAASAEEPLFEGGADDSHAVGARQAGCVAAANFVAGRPLCASVNSPAAGQRTLLDGFGSPNGRWAFLLDNGDPRIVYSLNGARRWVAWRLLSQPLRAAGCTFVASMVSTGVVEFRCNNQVWFNMRVYGGPRRGIPTRRISIQDGGRVTFWGRNATGEFAIMTIVPQGSPPIQPATAMLTSRKTTTATRTRTRTRTTTVAPRPPPPPPPPPVTGDCTRIPQIYPEGRINCNANGTVYDPELGYCRADVLLCGKYWSVRPLRAPFGPKLTPPAGASRTTPCGTSASTLPRSRRHTPTPGAPCAAGTAASSTANTCPCLPPRPEREGANRRILYTLSVGHPYCERLGTWEVVGSKVGWR